MEEKNNIMDELFKGRLGNFSPEPPKDVWENIELELENENVKRFPWIKIAAAAMFAATIAIIPVLNYQNNRQVDTQNSILSEIDISNSEEIPQNTLSNDIAEDDNETIKPSTNADASVTFTEKQSREERKETITAALENNEIEKDGINNIASVEESSNNENEIITSNLKFLDLLKSKDFNTDVKGELLKNAEFNPRPVNEKPLKEKRGNFLANILIGGQISPTYSYRNTGGFNTGVSESPLLSSSGGIYMEGMLSERFFLKTGLYYLQIGNRQNNFWMKKSYTTIQTQTYEWQMFSVAEQEEVNYVVFDNSIGTIELNENTSITNIGTSSYGLIKEGDVVQLGNIDLNDVAVQYATNNKQNSAVPEEDEEYEKQSIGTVQKLSNIEIPLMARYKFKDGKKLDLNIIGGLSANFITNSYVYNGNNNEIIGETVNINKINMSGSIALGLEYPVLHKISITLEPTFKYFMNSINTDNYVSIHPYSFGVYSGIRYTL